VGEAVAKVFCDVGIGEGSSVSEGSGIGAEVGGTTVDKVVKGSVAGGVFSPDWLQPASKIITRNDILTSIFPESILNIPNKVNSIDKLEIILPNPFKDIMKV
jgi:hypothetical protein